MLLCLLLCYPSTPRLCRRQSILWGRTASSVVRAVTLLRDPVALLVQDSLGGGSKTVLLCTVTPAAAFSQETAMTLDFATTAKLIKTNVSLHFSTLMHDVWRRVSCARTSEAHTMPGWSCHLLTRHCEHVRCLPELARKLPRGSQPLCGTAGAAAGGGGRESGGAAACCAAPHR